MTDELNECGILLLDIYMLDYCGIKVFFQVCKTTRKTVYLVELATKETEHGIMLSKGLKASKDPLIVLTDNTPTKSKYEVTPIKLNGKEYWLPIPIGYSDPIHAEATRYSDFPPCGYAYAVPIGDVVDKYWEKPHPIERKKKTYLA